MGSVKRIVLLMIGFTLLSGSYLWAHGDKHTTQDEKKIQGHHWAAPMAERKRTNPIPLTEESVQRGEELYINNCIACHGVKGDGKGPDAPYIDPKPSNLKAMAAHHPDGDLAWKIKKGKGPMPSWEDEFTEEQIWDLVNYIQSLKTTP